MAYLTHRVLDDPQFAEMRKLFLGLKVDVLRHRATHAELTLRISEAEQAACGLARLVASESGLTGAAEDGLAREAMWFMGHRDFEESAVEELSNLFG